MGSGLQAPGALPVAAPDGAPHRPASATGSLTTSANKFVYGLGLDGIVKFKYMTGKRIKSTPTCVANADKTVTIYTGSNDHFVYKLTADAQKVLRGTSWYNQ